MKTILFLHDTPLSTLRGAELTIKQLIVLGEQKGYSIIHDSLKNFDKTKDSLTKANFVVVNSTSRCEYELKLIKHLIKQSVRYCKVEYDYNFCVRRNILCKVDPKIRSCCNPDKFHLFRKLFSNAAFNVFQSPKHYQSHYEFYGEAVANKLIMPPTVDVDNLHLSEIKDKNTMPFFGDLNYLKGGHEFVTFAEENPHIKCKVYGNNRLRRNTPKNIKFKEPISNTEVLKVLGKTNRLICKPVWLEPSGRLAAEAFLSGCEIIGNDRIGTFSFNFYPNNKERAIQEIKQAPENFWNKISEALQSSTDKTQKSLGRVLVYKSYGGLGDIFFAIPAIYKLTEVSDVLDFAVAPRLVDFFSKHLKKVNVVNEKEVKEKENEYDNIYELGNYPAFRGYDLPHALKYPTHKKVNQHAIQHYIDTVSKLHIDIDNRLKVYPYFKRKEEVKKPYFVVHHGAGFLLKIWPTDKYAKLIERLHDIYPNLDCKIIKGPDDPDIEKYFSKEMPHVKMVTGGMIEVGDAMAGALFHIGNDAGITHVAGAFNVPSVGIYGPTGPGSWGSFAEHNELIWGKKGVCDVRCNYDVILNCDHKICLNSVTVNRVLEAVYKVLQSSYPEKISFLKVNPEVQIEFSESDCLLKLREQELLMEYHSDIMKQQVENILSGKKQQVPENDTDFQQVIEVLKQQHILFNVPKLG